MDAAPSGYRVLLAQGDREIAQVLQKYFAGRGMAVDVAHDLESATAMFSRGQTDIVLVEVALPGGGLNFLDRVRGLPTRGKTPVLVIGPGAARPEEERAWRETHKADGVFHKPLPLKDVVTTMDELVARASNKRRQGSFFPSTPGTGQTTGSTTNSSLGRVPTQSGFGRPITSAGVIRQQLGAPMFSRPMTNPGPRTQATAPLTGEAALPALAAVSVEVFERRLSGVLEVKDVGGTRKVCFHDGWVVDVISPNMLEAMPSRVDAERLSPTELCERADDTARGLCARVLIGGLGTFVMSGWEENAILASRVRLDPIECLFRACFALADDDAAEKLLAGMENLAVHRSPQFQERVALLTTIRPQAVLPAKIAQPIPLKDVLELARAGGPSGVRELLSLILSRALHLGLMLPGATRPPPHRPAQPWKVPGLSREQTATRELIAAEYARTYGRDAYDTLAVPRDASEPMVAKAVDVGRAKFGPPTLDGIDLGPYMTLLEIIRARREESARILSSATARFAYNATLRALGATGR